ncbi:unnamed protein product [Prunus armeniaca]
MPLVTTSEESNNIIKRWNAMVVFLGAPPAQGLLSWLKAPLMGFGPLTQKKQLGQAQGQILPMLQPKGADVSSDVTLTSISQESCEQESSAPTSISP